ncbi:MAG: type VI secretion system contractile sheath large subunit, partial [Planctomycetota bacterium]
MPEEARQQQPGAAAGGELSLFEQLMAESKISPEQEGYEEAKRGVGELIKHLLGPARGTKADKAAIDAMIAGIDEKLSSQIDEILHDEKVQKLESAWRGLKMVVDRTDFRENVKLELFNCSKQALIDDFEDSPEIVQSGLYKNVYTNEYGQFGGEPYGA